MSKDHNHMNTRYWILIGVLVIVAIITYFLSRNVPAQQNAIHAEQLPLLIKGWYGKGYEVDDRTLEILETDDVIMRTYKKGQNLPVDLCIVYASNNRKVAHPPEICYKGGGWSLEAKKKITLSVRSDEYPKLDVIKLIIEKGDIKLLVFYWFTCNRDYTSNYYRQQINIVMSGIKTGKSTSGLLRFSTQIANNDEDGAMLRIQEFIMDALPLITKHLP